MKIKYYSEIKKAAEAYHLDPLMVASVVRAESGFNPNAKSYVGAKGLMQLMPATDKWLDNDIDGYDIEGNLDNGCMYLNWLRRYFLRKFPELKDHELSMWKIVWAGYNAGQGNIYKAIKNSKNFNFNIWKEELKKITGKYSKETINYVKKIEKFWNEYVSEKEKQNKNDEKILINKKSLNCILTMLKSAKSEIEKIVDENSLKGEK